MKCPKKEHNTLRGIGRGRLAPWQRLFAHCHNTIISNHKPREGKKKTYKPNNNYNKLNTKKNSIIIRPATNTVLH